MADTSAREFIVTRDFIHKYKTANGGWTRAQTDVLGISWPLQPGWMRSAIGRKLTDEQVEQFISGREIRASKKHRKPPPAPDPNTPSSIDRYDKLKAEPDGIQNEYPN